MPPTSARAKPIGVRRNAAQQGIDVGLGDHGAQDRPAENRV